MTATPPDAANRLGAETSPYLLQHKDNPVHWWSWSDDAFAAAATADKPILLSVGYAACHWCHVMAHESFEDDGIAAVMNDLYINIKVDREERPDVDAIYQKALAALGEHGGWPLTMFLTPDGRPFFGGTYFPPSDRWGRPGFRRVLERVSEVYHDDRKTVTDQAGRLTGHLTLRPEGRLKDPLSKATLNEAAEQLLGYMDPVNGGLKGAPKFPMCGAFEFLWRAYVRSGDDTYKTAVVTALDRISQGGIYDHLGGGFARYATEETWLVPHFEKMLYDNAQLIDLLALVWQDTGSSLYAQRVRETIAWLTREMMGENGAFAATLDADSEGEEGKFYVWSEAEIDAVLGPDATVFKAAYDVNADGNWEGKTILNRSHAGDDPGDDPVLARAREKLLAERDTRVRPGRDDKVLADWNGLMIAALARAGLVFGQPDWIALARSAFDAVCATMVWNDGEGRKRLGHSLCAGKLQRVDMLDDYALMMQGALALHTATGDSDLLQRVQDWAVLIDDLFRDEDDHGYFFTAADAEHLIVRTSSIADSATPSGNGMLVGVFAHLFYLTGTDRYRLRAEALIETFAVEAMRSFPHSAALLNGFETLSDGLQVVIIGARADTAVQGLLRAALSSSLPGLILSIVAEADDLPPAHPASGKTAIDGKATAYVCRGPVCQAPVTDGDTLIETLRTP